MDTCLKAYFLLFIVKVWNKTTNHKRNYSSTRPNNFREMVPNLEKKVKWAQAEINISTPAVTLWFQRLHRTRNSWQQRGKFPMSRSVRLGNPKCIRTNARDKASSCNMTFSAASRSSPGHWMSLGTNFYHYSQRTCYVTAKVGPVKQGVIQVNFFV